MATDYKIGSMDIAEQNRTFTSFINWSVWGGLLVAIGVFGLVLVFGAHMQWFLVTFLMVILGTIAGAILKMPLAWYGTLGAIFGLSVFGLIISTIIGAFI